MATDNKILDMIELAQSTIQTCAVSKLSLVLKGYLVHDPIFGGILQMLSRKKPAVGPGSGNTVSSAKDSKKKRKLPKLEDFLQMRDYTGASTLLEVMSVVILALQGKGWLGLLYIYFR